MSNLDNIIKVVKRMAVRDIKHSVKTSHEEIINHTLEQQGVYTVIKILELINNGDINMGEYLRETERE